MTQDFMNIRVRLRENVSGLAYSVDSPNYDGDLTMDDRTLKYTLRFGVPIDRLDELARENPNFAMQQIHLSLTDESGRLLNDGVRAHFMGIIPALAIEFYYRDSTIPMCLERSRMMGYSEIEREYHLPRTAELENILKGR